MNIVFVFNLQNLWGSCWLNTGCTCLQVCLNMHRLLYLVSHHRAFVYINYKSCLCVWFKLPNDSVRIPLGAMLSAVSPLLTC